MKSSKTTLNGEAKSAFFLHTKHLIVSFFCFFLIVLTYYQSFAGTKLSLGMVTRGTLNWPVLIALEKGFFSQEDLSVEALELKKPSVVVQSLVAGSTPIAISGIESAITAIDKGASTPIISSLQTGSPSILVGQSKFRSVKDLKKVKIGSSGPGETTRELETILNREGLRKNDDYVLITLGSTRERYLALRAGAIDAAVLSPTASFDAAEVGLSVLAFADDYVKKSVRNINAVNRTYANENPDVVVKYLRSMIKATRWLTDNKNKNEATSILIKYEKMTPTVGQRIYDFLINKIHAFPNNAEITSEAIRGIIADLTESGLMSKSSRGQKTFTDLTYLDLVIKELGTAN